jgi:hypothetical protein
MTNTKKRLAMLFIGVGILLSGCGERDEPPVALDNAAVPPVPVAPPGKVGDSPGQGLAHTPGPEGVAAGAAEPGINVPIADIMNRPELYLGRVVTVVSEVEDIFTPWSFKLDEDQTLTGGVDNDLLVVGAVPITTWGFDESWKNQRVKVTGTVRILQPEDFQREYGRGVDDLLFRRYVEKPTVVARSAEKIE